MARPVNELKRTMSWRELHSWQVFDALHPLPDRLPDIHHGILMSTLVNMMRAQHQPPAVATDYFVLREPIRSEPEVARADGLTEAERLKRIWESGD